MRSPFLFALIKSPQLKLSYKKLLDPQLFNVELFQPLPFLRRSPKQISLQRMLLIPFLLQTAAAIGLTGYLVLCSGHLGGHLDAASLQAQSSLRVQAQSKADTVTPARVVPINLILILWASVLTGAIALTLLTSCRMTHLLAELSHASQKMAQGELPMSISQVKEFSVLMQSFEEMSQEVQQLRQQLADSSQILERKVAEQTQELQAELQRRTAIGTVLQEANRELQRLAFIDGLTQVANRRYFDQILEQEWWRQRRSRSALSLILCDIDFFKQYNDRYGHPAGDACLRKIAHTLSIAVKRPADLVTRYGGEEFAIILPNTPIAGAISVADALRSQVQGQAIRHEGSTVSAFVSISLGVASLIPTASTTSTQLVVAADQALYQAKIEGRNRIIAIDLDRQSLKRKDAVGHSIQHV